MGASPPQVCRLCVQTKTLRQSHIIPEFMHEIMYDPKHRFFGLSSNAGRKEKILQKGIREPLLCEDCEQRFGRHENYAKGVFFGGRQIGVQSVGNVLYLSGLEYAPLKLFFMSLLWRMGVTSLEFLKGIDLGPHEYRLRLLLLADDPSDFLTYPCMLAAVMVNGRHVPDIITRGGFTDIAGQRVWTFVAAGFMFAFVVSDQPPPVESHGLFLSASGTLPISVREIETIPSLHETFIEIGQAQRLRDARRK